VAILCDTTSSGYSDSTVTVWTTWNAAITTSSDITWTAWASDWDSTTTAITIGTGEETWYWWNAAEGESAEQAAARLERERIRAEEQRIVAEARKEAEARAEKLLQETLSEEQRKEIERHRYFTVESLSTRRRYRVRTDKGRHGNIEEVDESGRVLNKLCCAPHGNIPHADALVGQALNLRLNEDEFRRAANITRVA
jgi:hypothetical protein